MDDEDSVVLAKIRTRGWKSLFQLSVLILYLLLGALLFNLLEHDARRNAIEGAAEELEENRAELLKVLWGASIAQDEDDWTATANERLDLYERELKNFVNNHIDIDNPYHTDNAWNFIGSFFYAFTVITTIGYGNAAPETEAGKVATIIYGVIGIPLTLMLLAEVGKCSTLMLKYHAKRSQAEAVDTSEEFNFGPVTAIIITFIILFTFASIFSLFEDWDLLDASYFSFVTFSTIGFGDFVPKHQEYLLFIMLFVFAALSVCSMCFCSLQEWAEKHMNTLQDVLCTAWQNHRSKGGNKKKDDDDEKSQRHNGSEFKISPKIKHRTWNQRVTEDEEEVDDAEEVED